MKDQQPERQFNIGINPTPGEWEVKSGYRKPFSVWSGDLLIVARVHGKDHAEALANAELIASAPSLQKQVEEQRELRAREKDWYTTTLDKKTNRITELEEALKHLLNLPLPEYARREIKQALNPQDNQKEK